MHDLRERGALGHAAARSASVFIVVEPLDADTQAAGLTPALLKQDAELRQQTGCLPMVAAASKPEHAILSIAVRTAKGEKGDLAFRVVVQVLRSQMKSGAPSAR